MAVVAELSLLQPLDGKPAWSRKGNTGVCRLARRWDVKLVYKDGYEECRTAEFLNSGHQRDAFVLDDCRILKLSPGCRKRADQNKVEADTHAQMRAATSFQCVPDVFGYGRVRVDGYEYSWIIVERARWTLSDLMVHSKASAHAGGDAPPSVSGSIMQRFACGGREPEPVARSPWSLLHHVGPH